MPFIDVPRIVVKEEGGTEGAVIVEIHVPGQFSVCAIHEGNVTSVLMAIVTS